jgi:hypothetical protein
MSSQLTSLVTIFDGQNYGTWSKAMCTFLMAQGLWSYADGTNTEPFLPTDPTPVPPLPSSPAPSQKDADAHKAATDQYKADKALYDAEAPGFPAALTTLQKGNSMALGNITLRLSPAIQQCLSINLNAEETWDWLLKEFGIASIPFVYKDPKEAISIHLNPNQHPGPQLDKMCAAFGCLGAASFGPRNTTVDISPLLQGLIAMAAIPQKWDNLIPIICNGYETHDIDIAVVREVLVTQYENETNRGSHKGGSQANKLSAVK